jgi:hypothetical protein
LDVILLLLFKYFKTYFLKHSGSFFKYINKIFEEMQKNVEKIYKNKRTKYLDNLRKNLCDSFDCSPKDDWNYGKFNEINYFMINMINNLPDFPLCHKIDFYCSECDEYVTSENYFELIHIFDEKKKFYDQRMKRCHSSVCVNKITAQKILFLLSSKNFCSFT